MSFFKLISNLLGISKKKELSKPVSRPQRYGRTIRPRNNQNQYHNDTDGFGYAPQINDVPINTTKRDNDEVEDDSHKRITSSHSSSSTYHSSSDSSSSSCDSSSSSSSSCD